MTIEDHDDRSEAESGWGPLFWMLAGMVALIVLSFALGDLSLPWRS